MIRYWFEFDFENYKNAIPPGVYLGCGITAYTYDQAITILANRVFVNKDLPRIIKIVENIDVSKLDQGKVIPNMKPPIYEGVWFPLGY